MRVARRRVTGTYVSTLTSVDIVVVIICAGTFAPVEATPAPAMAPPWIRRVLSSAAHHMTITAALMDWMSMAVLVILAAQAAHLPTRMKTVKTITRGREAPQGVTTPTNTADTLEMMPDIPALMVAVSR